MDFFYPFPCHLHHIAFDRLKSHTQFPCPASKMIYIFLKFQCVLCILNFSVANTVIRKESYFRINVCRDIINGQRNKGPRPVPCGTPDKTRAQSDFALFITTRCCLKHRKESIYFRVFPLMPQPNSLLLRRSCGRVSNFYRNGPCYKGTRL